MKKETREKLVPADARKTEPANGTAGNREAETPGRRKFLQASLLGSVAVAAGPVIPSSQASTGGPVLSLTDRVTQLEGELRTMREVIRQFAQTLGEPDPFAATKPVDPSRA